MRTVQAEQKGQNISKVRTTSEGFALRKALLLTSHSTVASTSTGWSKTKTSEQYNPCNRKMTLHTFFESST